MTAGIVLIGLVALALGMLWIAEGVPPRSMDEKMRGKK